MITAIKKNMITAIRGQSTLEYLIVLVIVIAIIFTFARVAFRDAIEGSLNKLGDNIKNAADNF